jgi:hypothetical protein
MAWNPWAELRNRPHIRFARTALPDGIDGWHARRGNRTAILIDDTLLAAERNAVLAHELIHDERGGGPGWEGQPDTWSAVVARDERSVDAEVARRLVSADELAAFLEAGHPEPVEAWQIAERFDVPPWVVASLVVKRSDKPHGR